ncbi:MAG: hypothetical protein VBE63_28265, partial [Lamprobacter sp.]|uniref:hypothetical protein n=1 Tax=Lamprobacter sp. TaxID=3100796 RepID=UPI002B2638D2
SYGPWFKNFPAPAPITIRPRDWLEVKASFGQALQTEITKRRAATDPCRADAAAESLGDLRLQEVRA